MSDGDGDPTTTVPVPPPVARGWRRPLVLILALSALVGGVLHFGQPRDAFIDGGDQHGVRLTPGEQMLVGLGIPSRTVHVTSAEPIVSDGIEVRVSVRECQLVDLPLGTAHGADIGEVCLVPPVADGLPAGSIAEPNLLDEASGSLDPIEGPPTRGDVQLVVVIEPLEAGTVTIEDVELTHSNGPFHRTERIGPTIRVESDPAFAG